MPKQSEVTVFNDTSVYCLQPKEAVYLAKEVNDYLTHGIVLKPGDTIFDVGANIGIFSLWAFRSCKNDANIYSFEPIPEIANVLKMNAEKLSNGAIRVMPFGLSHSEFQTDFTYYPKATVWSTAYPALASQERTQTKKATLNSLEKAPAWIKMVPTRIWSSVIDYVLHSVLKKTKTVRCSLKTLSSVIREQNIEVIHLLKIDVEHGELDVLRGIENEHWPLIQQVVMEVHDIDGRKSAVENLLKKFGFKNIIADQQDVLIGTNIYLLYAMR